MKVITELRSHACEIDYFRNITKILKDELDDSFYFYEYNQGLYEYLPENVKKIKQNQTDIKKIALHCGNEFAESGFDNKLYEYFDLVFRFYQSENCDNKKIFEINIGYNSSGDNKIIFDNTKSMDSRENDVFFSGKIGGRNNFQQITKLKNPKYKINITPSFRGGYNINEYVNILSNSKICLAPNGVSPQTFRYSEAFASGCIVITNVKFNTWYGKHSPAYVVNDWSEVTEEYIQEILNSDLEEERKKSIEYYEKYLSPHANAEYILKVITNKYHAQ